MAITTQKIVGVLRKAGLPIVTYHKVSKIRGLRSVSRSGFRVRNFANDEIHISYDAAGRFPKSYLIDKIEKAQKVIKDAGIESVLGDSFGPFLTVRRDVSATPEVVLRVGDITKDNERIIEVRADGSFLVSYLEAEEAEAAIAKGARRVTV